MSFYGYENWTHERARIHRSGCGYCNDGRRTQANDSARNRKWHGPYEDRELASAVAKNLKRADTKPYGTYAP